MRDLPQFRECLPSAHINSGSSDRSLSTSGLAGNALCSVVVLLAFALVYSRSLAFVYVEGDDAAVVAYHALGRNSQLQPFYSPYQSMLDALLSLLPPVENTVRYVAMTLAAVSAPLFFCLTMVLAFDWCAEIRQAPKWLLAAVMLLAVPEFFYLGMVLTPSLSAMALLVGAHLIIRRATVSTTTPAWNKFAVSLLVFGVGAAFRWDTVTYGATIAIDLFLRAGDRSEHPPTARERLRLSFTWGVLAGLAWLMALMLNGWGLAAILNTIVSQGPAESLDWKLGLARAQTFFTPAFVALAALGFYVVVRKKHPLALIAVLAIVPVSRLLLYGVPKWFVTVIPSLLGCATVGLCLISQRRNIRYALLALVVCPWLVGVQWSYGRTAWGPGFELQPYYSVAQNSSAPFPTFAAGMAIPTPEGPRPLLGHGWVLLGGWRQFVTEYSAEQEAAVSNAIKAKLPLLLDEQGQSWFVNILITNGYFTEDSAFRTIGDNSIMERRWIGRDGSHMRIFQFTKQNDLFNSAAIDRLRAATTDTVIISAYSSTMLRLQQIAPESLEARGKRTALLHLDRLYAKLPRS